MSVSSEITRLSNAKTSIRSAIVNKGVSVPISAKLPDMATYIGQIQTNVSDLNFKVVGSASQPTTTSTNLIWVNTSTAITSWAMQGTEPTGSAGMVWIKIALDGDTAFNSLKSNSLTIAVVKCQQYIDGAWVNKEAQIYIGGAWVAFSSESLVLFEVDGSCASNWTNSGWTFTQGGSYSIGAGTISESSLKVNAAWGTSYIVLGTASTVDLTNYSKLHVDYSFTSGGISELRLCTGTNLNTTVKSQTITSGTSVELDISALSGAHYIVFDAAGSNSYGYNGVLTVTNVYLV